MTETAGAVRNGLVLRMSLPATGDLGALAPELGVKLAEQLGVAHADAAKIGDAVARLAAVVASAPSGDLSFAFHKDGADLRIEVRQGDQARTATVPLHA